MFYIDAKPALSLASFKTNDKHSFILVVISTVRKKKFTALSLKNILVDLTVYIFFNLKLY